MSKHRRPDVGDFEIAIICALPLERDAVIALLDEDYEKDGLAYQRAHGDDNAYTLGRMGTHHVIVVHMPGMGTVSATAVAVNLRSTFEMVRVAFVVGICGGVPEGSSAGEILLGDVIISTSVIQVDFGRQYPDGFKRKKESENNLGRAKPEIRAFVGKLSGHHSRQRLRDKTHSWSTQIACMNGFAVSRYPGPEYDILHATEHRHKHWTSGCEICDKCENSNDEVCKTALSSDCDGLGCQGVLLESRKRLQKAMGVDSDGHPITTEEAEDARRPKIHFGRMACGSQLMKSGIHRDHLAKEEQVIGFEMESAGLWDYIPTIVVKSVCDYADSHKNKRWQHYAAATAAACTKAMVEEWRSIRDRDQGPSISSTYPVYWNITRPVNALFTGRQDVLRDLECVVRKAVEDASRCVPCHIVISGIGGQGKSEVCLQLAHQLRQLFWGVFWIDVSTTTSAENGFSNVASCLGAQITTWDATKQLLANAKEPWLLVLDNADDPSIDYQCYFPASTRGVVILTSRNSECERYATERWVDLKELDLADAKDLLFRAARVSTTNRGPLDQYASTVAQLLQSHALALIQAGSYIGRGHCSLQDYPQVYERQRKRLLAFRPTQAQSRYQDVYATFEASAETLASLNTEASLDALQLLPVLAVFAPNRLPLILFEAAWTRARLATSNDAPDDDAMTMTLWHFALLPGYFQSNTEAWDSFRLIEALALLKSFSLISMDVEESVRYTSMHPLVHAWAWDRLDLVQQHTYLIQAACIAAFANSKHDLWHTHGRNLQPHMQAVTLRLISSMHSLKPPLQICRIVINCGWVLNQLRDDSTLLALMNTLNTYLKLDRLAVNSQWLDIYDLLARSLCDSGLTKDAITIYEQLVDIREQRLAEDHPSRLGSQHQLAILYQRNGQVREALTLIEHVVQIREQRLAEDHPSRLASQHQLAMLYQEGGQVQKALALLEHVVKIEEQTLAEDHPDRLASQHELASVYRENGQVREALTLIEHVVKIREQTLAEDHPSRLASQHELASVYRENGQVREALTLIEHVVKIREQRLAEDHPDRLTSQHELAILYQRNGQVREALTLIEHVVQIQEQRLADDHPSRLASQHQLAMLYQEGGQVQKALALLEHVVQIREQRLAKDHPSRLASQHELAMLYQEGGQVQKALALLEHVVKIEEQTLAEDHPSRLASQHELASVYRENGQVQKALALLEHVVKIKEQRLAKDHPDRLTSQHELASVYRENGQVQKALALLEHVVKIREQRLPEDHPHRLVSQHVLAVCLWETGNRRDAMNLMQHVVNTRKQSLDKQHPHRIGTEKWLQTWETQMSQR